MIIMLNGSFGVGKSTVAGLLRTSLPGSVMYDPEWVGSILMRLPKQIRLRGAGTHDFQDIAVWRRSAVAGTRLFDRFASGPVIVPMAFSRHDYFDEVVLGIKRFDAKLRVFCLRASAATINQRLVGRGTPIEGPRAAWIVRRVRECVEAHRDPHFGQPVDTEGRSAGEVAVEILRTL